MSVEFSLPLHGSADHHEGAEGSEQGSGPHSISPSGSIHFMIRTLPTLTPSSGREGQAYRSSRVPTSTTGSPLRWYVPGPSVVGINEQRTVQYCPLAKKGNIGQSEDRRRQGRSLNS